MASFELAILVVPNEVRYPKLRHISVIFYPAAISLGFGQGHNPAHVIEFMIS